MKNSQPALTKAPSKSAEVKAYFDRTEEYLKEISNINTRTIIVGSLIGKVIDAKILDIGCGDGSISRQFLSQGNRVTMVDISDQMLRVAQSRTPEEFQDQVEYINTNFLNLEADGQYDVVLCIGVLAHVDSVEEAIRKVSKLVKPGGLCVFQMTDTDQLMGRMQHSFSALRRLMKRVKKHSQNKIGLSRVRASAARHDLVFVSKKKYMIRLPVPGVGKLPQDWLTRFDLFTMRHPALARHGAETIVLFKKR